MNNYGLHTDPLPEWLAELAGGLSELGEVRYLATVGSTNTWLKEQLATGVLTSATSTKPLVLFTDRQTSGRGTRGRSWVQPTTTKAESAQDLALSITAQQQSGLLKDQRLSLLVGALVLRALAASAVEMPQGLSGLLATKWPNDMLGLTAAGWRKLGGILIETREDSAGATWIVIGIGLNVNSQAVDFPPELASEVTTLRDLAHSERRLDVSIDRAVLAKHLLLEILPAVNNQFSEPDQLMREWLAGHQTIERQYVLKRNGQVFPVRARAVDPETGALIVEDESGRTQSVISYTDLEELPAK